MKIFIKWLCGNYITLSLVLVVAFIISIPLFVYGLNGAFYYRYDPDIIYIANALLYTKAHIILYIDHPGTPTIMLLNWLFIPTRLIAKYIFHEGFIQWAFSNFAFLEFYLRLFMLTLFGTSLFIFLKVIKKMSKSVLITILTFLAFFSFSTTWYQGIYIVPENFSFFLTVIWLSIFIEFRKKSSYLLNTILVLVAGFAVANKFTNGFLLIPSLLFLLFSKNKINQKLGRVLLNIVIAVSAFILGVWPIFSRLGSLFRWVGILFFHIGIYGNGRNAIFDLVSYSASVTSSVRQEPFVFAVVCTATVVAIYLLIKRTLKIIDPEVIIFLTALLGIMVFAKYDIVRYNFINYLLIIFCLAHFLSRIRTNFLKVVIGLLAIVFIYNGYLYLTSTINGIGKETILQNYYDKNPPIFNTLWGVDNKYNIINHWTIYWVANVFGEQFNAKPLLMLSKDLTEVNVIGFQETLNKNIFSLCWDHAYLTKEDATKFLTIYKDKKLIAKPLPVDNSVYEITSKHCAVKSIIP
jgi:hypothetical protein